MDPSPAPAGRAEITPKFNSFVKSRLPQKETNLAYADYTRALAAYKPGDEAQAIAYTKKVIPRVAQYGYLPASVLPMLLVFSRSGSKKSARRLQKVVDYLIQVILGDGSAGTPMPSPGIPSELPLPKAVDNFSLESMQPVWSSATNDFAPYANRSSALRILTATAKAVQTSRPDDSTLVKALMEALYGVLDQTGSTTMFGKRKRKSKREIANQYEKMALQRLAFWAARVGLSTSSLRKMAPLCFQGVSSQDPVGARHALALTALLANGDSKICGPTLEASLQQNLDAFYATGALTNVVLVRLPLQDGPIALNLQDAWARVYLARACGALLHSSSLNLDVSRKGAVFWETLLILACYDSSELVTLEAIRALLGSTNPSTSSIRNTEAPQKLEARHRLDEKWEADNSRRLAAGWQLLCKHANDEIPQPPRAQAPTAVPKTASAVFSPAELAGLMPNLPNMKKSASAVGPGGENPFAKAVGGAAGGVENPFAKEGAAADPNVNPFANEAAAATAAAAAAAEKPPAPKEPEKVMETILQRLLKCLGISVSVACGVCRTVGVLAEARAHAHAASPSLSTLGCHEVQEAMFDLQTRMQMITREPHAAQLRQLAVSALIWFHLPNRREPLPTSAILSTMTKGGTPLVPGSPTPFLAPWPADCTSALLRTLLRRLVSNPNTAEYVLQAANAAVAACPGRANEEQLQLLWDSALQTDVLVASLAAVRAALELLHAHSCPVAQPPSTAANELQAAAATEHTRLSSLSRLAAFWLGENANYATDEYVWANKPPPPPAFHPDADVSEQEKLAVAAAMQNPVLASVISNLQRALLTCIWEVRTAAAGALAKIAVRSGEPYRVQCYSVLAATRVDGADPLGLAAVVEPALQVLDDLYAGEITLDSLTLTHGGDASEWPDPVKEAVITRHNYLLRLVSERIGFMPKEVFYPLGHRSRAVITGQPDTPIRNKNNLPPEDSSSDDDSSAPPAGPAFELTDLDLDFLKNYKLETQDSVADSERSDDTTATPRKSGPGSVADHGEKPSGGNNPLANNPLAAILGGDFTDFYGQRDSSDDDETPTAAAGAASGGGFFSGGGYGGYEEKREEPIEEEDDGQEEAYRGEVLYDFTAENDEEVSVYKGEEVEVQYDMGGWIQVVTNRGTQGFIPSSYVRLPDGALASSSAPSPINTTPSVSHQHSASRDQPYPFSPDALAQSPFRATTDFQSVSAGPGLAGPLASAGSSGAWPQREAVVAYEFTAEGEGEVDVKVGQQVTVVGEVDGWVQIITHPDGQQGLVPASYVEYV